MPLAKWKCGQPTIPDLQPKSEWESINYVSDEDLKEWECDSLFDSLITGDYEMGSYWNSCFLSVTWSDGDQEDVEKAIADYLDAAPSQADIDEYKRLKAKLGLCSEVSCTSQSNCCRVFQ